jgi:antitoxin (DNA-binding transcriptional repressor) of toxin-antitoxin stability system
MTVMRSAQCNAGQCSGWQKNCEAEYERSVIFGANLGATKNGCRLLNIRTVTIRELHLNTRTLVCAAGRQKITITDRGRPIALLKTLDEPDLVGKPFSRRDIRKMPKSKVDSTIYVSQDRDRR